MRNHAQTSRATVQAPEIFFAVSRVGEKSFVLALEICRDKKLSYSSFHVLNFKYLPVPGSGVVGGSGVVSLLLNDSSFESRPLFPSSLRRTCFLRFLLELDRFFPPLLFFPSLDLSRLFAPLTAFPLSEFSSSSSLPCLSSSSDAGS